MLIQTTQDLYYLLEALENSCQWVYDVETTGLDIFRKDRIIGIAIGHVVGDVFQDSYYLPFRHRVGQNLPLGAMRSLAPLLADPELTIIGWNLKFDINATEQEGLRVHNRQFDSLLAVHLANENFHSYQLKTLGKIVDKNADEPEARLLERAKEFLKKKNLTVKTVKRYLDQLPPEMVAEYAEQDVALPWRLKEWAETRIDKQDLMPLLGAIQEYGGIAQRMEARGLRVDPMLCQEGWDTADGHRNVLKAKMFQVAGREFNPGSPKQLSELLQMPSTAKAILEESDHPLAEAIVEWRQWDRACTAYFGAYLEMIDENCRIHPNLKLHGTVSGRLSCETPNLQALPRGTDIYRVRDVIAAPRGYTLVSFDYSQIELRLLAYYTQDPNLLSAYQGGEDIHTQTAKATGLDRDKAPGAKTLNFATVYGLGLDGCMRKFKFSEQRARQVLNAFHTHYREVRPLYYRTQQFAEQHGYIPLWTGRRRRYQNREECHKAMSNLIQGGVAEIMRTAITNLERVFYGTRVRMVLQVHDDILFEIPDYEVEQWLPIIQDTMQAFDFSRNNDPATRVPILAEGKFGPTWGTMQKWKRPEVAPAQMAPETVDDDELDLEDLA